MLPRATGLQQVEPYQVFTQNVDSFNRIMTLVDSDSIKINYDTGNAYLAGHDPVEYLKALGPERVVHVHANEGGRAEGAGRTAFLANGHDLHTFECPALKQLWVNRVH